MSLPAETKFPCMEFADSSITFDFDVDDLPTPGIGIEVDQEGCGITFAYLDRSQVESLRDQLSEWLAETGDA